MATKKVIAINLNSTTLASVGLLVYS